MATTKHPNQKSVDRQDAYLARIAPIVWNPTEYTANAWRAVVNAQEVASMCKDTLISTVLSLDWKVVVRDSDMQEELRATVKYYTKLFESVGYANKLDFTSHIEWIAADMLDTPFGGACEIGRKNGDPKGRVAWLEPLDAATLYPTLFHEYPVVQNYNNTTVYFDKYSIARAFISPSTRIERKGWGMPPPEKVFRSLQMLTMGDTYYANLLLDVPTAGILDLGDMEQSSAEEWIKAFKSLMSPGAIDSFKIPVLYEHNNPVNYIPFGKVPNDIMFDRITMKYAAIVCAAYGMTTGDIGLSAASGETLAGSIRQERRTKKTGFARLKKKLKFYFDQILPENLQFVWIDYDDETNVAVGRARLANATAFGQMIDKKVFTPKEVRLQSIQDGLVTISVPEDYPEEDAPEEPKPLARGTPERPGALGSTNIPASQGGEGEVVSGKSMTISDEFIPMIARSIVDELASVTDFENYKEEFMLVPTAPLLTSLGLENSQENDDVVKAVLRTVVDELGDIDFATETRDNITEKVETILSEIQIKLEE
jgi:hypothetical protein